MGVAERDARLLASEYRHHGEAAKWAPAVGGGGDDVTVIRLTDTELQDFGRGQMVVPTAAFRVRPSEVAEPMAGDEIRIPDRREAFTVIGEPMRTRFALDWVCQAKPGIY